MPLIVGIRKAHKITYKNETMYGNTLSCFNCDMSSSPCQHFHRCCIFATEQHTRKKKLRVQDVYTSSGEDFEDIPIEERMGLHQPIPHRDIETPALSTHSRLC